MKNEKFEPKTANEYLNSIKANNEKLTELAGGLEKDFAKTLASYFSLTEWQVDLMNKIPQQDKLEIISLFKRAAKAAHDKRSIEITIDNLPDGDGQKHVIVAM